VLRTRFHRVVFNDWGTSRPCIFPPMAVKSKPPAVRVVVDSEELCQGEVIMEMQNISPRQRVLRSLDHQESDRVPLDLGGINNTSLHVKIEERLKDHLGFSGGEPEIRSVMQQVTVVDERIAQHFQSDTRTIYFEEDRPWQEIDEGLYIDQWGLQYKLNPDGNYYNFCSHPLSSAETVQDIMAYEFPEPRADVRVAGLVERAKSYGGKYCLILEGMREPVFGTSSWLRGHTQFYLDLVSNKPMVYALLDRMLEFYMVLSDFLLERLGPYLDLVKIGDDLGSQNNLIISPAMYRELIKPRQKALYDHIKKKGNCKILLHSCGAIRKIIPDLIEIGVDALNPVQTTAHGMQADELKREFGREITFWGGGVDTQNILPFGTPEEVRNEVKKNLEIFKPDGGYVFAQIHNIMPEVPVENIMAMYEAFHEHAAY
jgi:uroporphyrinogen decarboxylase